MLKMLLRIFQLQCFYLPYRTIEYRQGDKLEIFEVIRTATEEGMHEVCKCFGEYIEHDDLVTCDRFFIAKMPSLTQKLVILKGGVSLWIIVIRSGVHYDLACGAEAGGFVLQQWLGVWTILAY